MLISCDNHAWPPWAPSWLRDQVETPDCSGGTHPRLRDLAKWLTVYFAEHEGEAERWLYHAACHCDRDVDDDELDRLLSWAEARFGNGDIGTSGTDSTVKRSSGKYIKAARPAARPVVPDLDEIFRIAEHGPNLEQYRASSPVQLSRGGPRHTERVLRQWAHYAIETDPWVCFGSDDCFWTRRLSDCHNVLHMHEQIVASPPRVQRGLTLQRPPRLSEHSLAAMGERTFLVCEFDFAPVTPRGKPTIWAPLLDRCEAVGITVLDMNAALIAHLSLERPVWMTVYSAGKSLQMWTPCRGESEESLHEWFAKSARRLGACNSTWCKSQFVRMPDGTRAVNSEGKRARQSIEFYNPEII
jgi:hypothetical protein